MAKAYYINDWRSRYEVNDKGNILSDGQKCRKAPLQYVRCRASGLVYGQGWRKLQRQSKKYGVDLYAVFGLFMKLLEIAACRPAEQRGYILDSDMASLGPERLAEEIGGDADLICTYLYIMIEDLKWLVVQECPFAIGSQKDDLQLEYFLAFSRFSGNSRRGGAPSERNRNETNNYNLTETITDSGESGEPCPAEQEKTIPADDQGKSEDAILNKSGGSKSLLPEYSESGLSDIGESGQASLSSESGKSDIEVSEDRTGQEAFRGSKATSSLQSNCQASASGKRLSYEFDLLAWDVERDDPVVMLDNFPTRESAQWFALDERAMRWFEALVPELQPSVTARESVRKQARGDMTCIQGRIREAWDLGLRLHKANPDIHCGSIVVKLVQNMQQKKADVARSRGRLHNLMALWMAESAKTIKDAEALCDDLIVNAPP
ncbi:MAG: hypothetical protein JEZ07_06390 [Phycisphaerae bacterium]|nr:hypothetical protein [Phycisphaerae bacterium]